jgi:hypothetical protein
MAESKLKVFRQQRGQVKRSMTLLEKFLSTFGDDDELSSIVDGEVKAEDLKRLRSSFEENHNGMTVNLVELEKNETDLTAHEKEYEHFEERYYAASSKLNSLIEAAKTELLKTQPAQTVAQSSTSNHHLKMQTSLKLPEIHLPVFDGQLVNYQSFTETFKALVHNDVRLSAIQKFFYLKACLKNTSICLEISSLELTGENYDLAWKLLVSRYENRKALINKHIKALFTLPKVDRNSASSLRQLIDNVSKHIHGMKSQQIVIDDAVLIYLVTSKIDGLSHQLWEAHDSNVNVDEVATFESLKMFMSNRARALENVEEFEIRSSRNAVPGQGQRFKNPTQNGQRLVLAALNYESGQCVLCQGKHPIWRCKCFLDKPIKEKLEFVSQKGLCEKCLKIHSEDCKFQFSCRVCRSARHNSLLHQDN